MIAHMVEFSSHENMLHSENLQFIEMASLRTFFSNIFVQDFGGGKEGVF